MDGLSEISVEGTALRARSDEAHAPSVGLQALEAGGVQVASVTVARPSLDDVYLRHAGRTFDAAHEETENQQKEEDR